MEFWRVTDVPSSAIAARLSLLISTVTARAGPVVSPGPIAAAVMADTDTTRAETSPPNSAAPVRGAVVPVGITRVATVSSTFPEPCAGMAVDTVGAVKAAEVSEVSEAAPLLLLVGEPEDGPAEPEEVVVRADDDAIAVRDDDEPAEARAVVDPEAGDEEEDAAGDDLAKEDDAGDDAADDDRVAEDTAEDDIAEEETVDPADEAVEDATTGALDDGALLPESFVAVQAPATSRAVSAIPMASPLRRRGGPSIAEIDAEDRASEDTLTPFTMMDTALRDRSSTRIAPNGVPTSKCSSFHIHRATSTR